MTTDRCDRCGEHFTLDKQGNIRTHGQPLPTGGLCPGSNQPPRVEIHQPWAASA